MAAIDLTSGSASAYGSGELQLQGKVQMTSTLTPVTDNLNNASPLNLSTSLVQTTSTLQITTSDVAYIDAEDNSGNNRFTVSRALASQLVTVDFASLPTALTTPVGAIRTGTDGVNLANVMTFLENGNIGINTDTAGAKLDVHSASNVIAQFNRTGTGKSWIQYLQAGTGRWNTGFDNVNGNFTIYDVVNSLDRLVVTNAGLVGIGTTTPASPLSIVNTIALAAGATNPRIENIAYTINNTGAQTGTATGIFLNATETALNGQTHNLMDLQVGGVSKVKVLNSGLITAVSLVATGDIIAGISAYLGFTGRSLFNSPSDGVMLISNNAVNSFNRLQFGGTTSSFPAIKRNGNSIDFRLADDSGFCSVNAAVINGSFIISSNGMASQNWYDKNLSAVWLTVADTTGAATFKTTALFASSGTINASAILQADSTTKGFLPPRMTTAQKNAITTPATGLVVFDTDLGKLCVFSVTWQTVTSV